MNQAFDTTPSGTSPIDAPPRPNTYPESVPRTPEQPPNAPGTPPRRPDDEPAETARPERRPAGSWWSRMWRNLGRDTVLVIPGLVISLIAFPVLIALFSVSISTVIIWIGVLLLPLTLYVATGFANLTRARARQWGAPIAEVVRRPRNRGFRAWIGVMADGRRWLDLLFETIFALPIHLFTFAVSVSWFFAGLGGVTFFFWGRFLPPDDTNLIDFVSAWVTNSPLTDLGFGAEATFQFVTGLVLLLTFPFVHHAMARLEILAITAGLAPFEGSGTSAGKARAGDEAGRDPSAAAAASAGLSSPAVAGSSSGSGADSSSGFGTEPSAGSGASAAASLLSRAGSEGWFWLLSIFVAVALVAISWPVTAVAYGVWTVTAMLIAIGQSAALVLAVRMPAAAIVLGVMSSAVGIYATSDSTGLVWPWATTSILALLFLHLIVGLRHSWLHLVILWAASAALGVLSLIAPHAGELSGALANVITTVSLTAGISAVAVVGNLWIRSRARLESERRLSAEELAKRQELEERNRIAQELHDVVAHSMSVISVQATTARYRLPDLDGRSLEEFDSIAGSARQALTEMRGLLAILRGGRDADLAPQPVLDDIPALVASTRGSGAEVELEFAAESAGISATVGLTAFRVVQEGLSNALRHAPGAAVQVTVRPVDEQLWVAVVNGAASNGADGGGQETAGHGGGPDHLGGDRTGSRHLGGGFGLKGMRERVEALDGTLRVGPTPEGGFEVVATLPTTTP